MTEEQRDEWNKDRPRRRKEFTELVKPLMKWLNENYNPYCSIYITQSMAEISETDITFVTEEFFVD
jgi:hypothetical protein